MICRPEQISAERKTSAQINENRAKRGINATGLKWSVGEKKNQCTNLTKVKENIL